MRCFHAGVHSFKPAYTTRHTASSLHSAFPKIKLSNLLLFAYQNELSYLKKRNAKWIYNFFIKLGHYLNQNTKKGSKKKGKDEE